MRRIFGTRCCKGRFFKRLLGYARASGANGDGGQFCAVQRPLCVKGAVSFRGPGEAQRQRVRWGEEEQRSDCAFRPQGGNKGCGACDDEIPGVMFYCDLTNRCSTCSPDQTARILIRGGVLTHCFRLFVPTAGAGGTLRFVQCMPNGGQSCTVQRPLCVKGAVSVADWGIVPQDFVAWSGLRL